jgi:rhamnosyl/mannosyltransferase
MRIGIATHNYPPHLGGLETIVRELTRGFASECEVIVVSTAWQGQSGVASEDGATVHRLPAWHGTERRGVPYAMPLGPGILRAVRALRSCDVLHAHGSLYSTTLLALLARRRYVPLFITEHVGFVPYSSSVLNGLQRLAWTFVGSPVVRRAKKVIAYNSRVRDSLATRYGAGSVVLIPNGVDTLTFRPRGVSGRRAARDRLGLPADGILGLFVGRDAEKKNLNPVLRHRAASYRLVVCGTGRTMPPDVFNLGALPHTAMPEVFAAADFLLHAATGEGFPVTVQEAMSSGLPVTLLWDTGYAGSVAPEALIGVNSFDELARVAATLAEDRQMRETFGYRARDYAVRNWNWNTTVKRYLDLFLTATGGRL